MPKIPPRSGDAEDNGGNERQQGGGESLGPKPDEIELHDQPDDGEGGGAAGDDTAKSRRSADETKFANERGEKPPPFL